MEHTRKAPMDTGISTEARGVINPTTGFSPQTHFIIKSRYITAHEIAEDCGIAKSTAYTVIRAMNAELREMGKITISGKVARALYEFKTYGGGQ